MNIYTLLSLTSAILTLSLGLLVYFRTNRNWLSFIFLLLSIGLALLNISQYQMRIASSFNEAYLWSKLFGVWALVSGFLVHFTYELNRKKRKSAFFYALVYLPGLLIFYFNLATNYIALEPIEKSWGWAIQYNYGFIHNVVASYGILFWIISLYFVTKYYLNSLGIRKKQALLIVIGFLVNFIITLITDFLFPIFKVNFPALGGAADIFTLILIGYAIWKYQMFSLDKDSLSKKILQSISNSIIITDNHRYILQVNQSFCDQLGYDETFLIGKKIDEFLDRTPLKGQNPLAKYIQNNSEFKNEELFFKTISGSSVSFYFSASFVEIVGHPKPGFIYVGVQDQIQQQTQLLLNENEKQTEFLAKAALDLVGLKTKEEVYEYIARKTYYFLNEKAVIGCTELTVNFEKNSWQVKALYGVDQKIQILSSILGFDIKHLTASTNKTFMEQLVEGKLTKLDFNLGDLTDGLLSNKMGEKAKALFGLKELHVIPIQYGDKFFGALHIASKNNTPAINSELIESFMSIVSIVLNRRHTEMELSKSERIFKTIVKDSEIIIFILDREGKFLLSEGKPLKKLGLKPGEVVGLSASDVYKDHPEIIKQIKRAIEGETVNELIDMGDGLYFNIRYTPYRNEKGEIIGTIGMADDISYQMLSENKLAELNKMQTRLFSVIGHDLKSPMANIISFSDLILSEFDTFTAEQIQRFAYNIQLSANNSYSILNSLLDWSKSVNSEFCFGDEIVCLKSASDESILQVIPLANKKNIKISNNIKEHVPVLADKNMVLTVIRNLLTNAIKFTAIGGRISISVSILEDRVELSVSDNGVGMTEEQVMNVFNFEGEKSSRGTKGETGSGIGLQICKEFMEKIGGRITAKSQLKEGSVFTLTFPHPKNIENKKVMINPN